MAETKVTNPGKPGWFSSEFIFSFVAMVVAYLLASDLVIGNEESVWVKGLALAATVLAAMGYTASRAVVKREMIRAKTENDVARIHKPEA